MIVHTEKEGVLTFKVRVVPRAARTEIRGEFNDALRVRLAAPPVDGAANVELVRALAEAFGVGKRAVTILSGHATRIKQVSVTGAKAEALDQLCRKA